MTRAGDTPERKLEGIWSPQQLGVAVGYSRQAVIHAINGKGKYPRRLYAQKVGQLWLIPDDHAEVYLHWSRTGELLEEPPIPEKLYWGVAEIAEASGMPYRMVERAVTGIQGTYSYPPTIPAQRFGQAWLVKPEDAQTYIQEKRQTRGSQE
jgi:hypothetical protein